MVPRSTSWLHSPRFPASSDPSEIVMDHHHGTQSPIFPLASAMVPGMVVPLRLFESRYRQLGTHLNSTPGRSDIATVMIERGSEVGGGEQRSSVGCLLEVIQCRPSDDGSWVLLTRATERIRVLEWMDDAPWPRGLIQRWPDDDGDAHTPSELRQLVTDLAELAVVGQAVGMNVNRPPLASLRPVDIGWYSAAAAPIGDIDRQRLLAAPTLAGRLRLLRSMVDEQLELVRLLEQQGREPSG